MLLDGRDDLNDELPPNLAEVAVRADIQAEPPTGPSHHLRRLATFSRLPRHLPDTVRPLALARDGFLYTGRGRVLCFYCATEVPLSECHQHRNSSPQCPAGGNGHSDAYAILHSVLLCMPLGVEIRQSVSPQELGIHLRQTAFNAIN